MVKPPTHLESKRGLDVLDDPLRLGAANPALHCEPRRADRIPALADEVSQVAVLAAHGGDARLLDVNRRHRFFFYAFHVSPFHAA